MDPHDLTKNQNLQQPDNLQSMQAMQAGQNFAQQSFPGKNQVQTATHLECSAERKLDSPVRPPAFQNSAQAQSSSKRDPKQSDGQVQSVVENVNALQALMEQARGKQTSSAGTIFPSGSKGLSTAQDVCSAPVAAQTSEEAEMEQANARGARAEVSEFTENGHALQGSGSHATQPQSVEASRQAILAAQAEHQPRGNQMNQQQFQPQSFAQGQQMMQQNQAFTSYLQQFVNMNGQAAGQANGVMQMPMLQFAGQQPGQQFGQPQMQFVVPQGQVMPQNMVPMIANFTKVPVMPAEQQIFIQMANGGQADAQKELTLEMLLRQMQSAAPQQAFVQSNESMQNFEQFAVNLAQGYYFGGNQASANMGMNFFQQHVTCNKCKTPGELIRCNSCQKPFHVQCAGLSQVPSLNRWECEECIVVARDNLIRQLKEKAQKKILEREKRKEAEIIAKNEAKMRREIEAKQRKEEKDRIREEQRQQRAEILQQAASQRKEEALKLKIATATQAGKDAIIDPDTQQPYDVQGPLKIGQMRSELIELVIQMAQQPQPKQAQLAFGPDGQLITISTAMQPTKKKKTEADLTPEERARKERNRLIKSQMQIFSNLYPELVERNSIRYPIKDELLLKLPELHCACTDPKPEPYKIYVSADEFEKLIYIWEFCNNFNDYMDTPTFKLEELKCALSYSEQDDPNANMNLKDENELEWSEQMRVKHIREKGLHMVNSLHTALVKCFLDDFFPDSNSDEPTHGANTRSVIAQQQPVQLVQAQSERDNQILMAIDKLIDNKHEVWPEITRLVLLYKIEQDGEDFGPNRETVDSLLGKLIGLRPTQYHTTLTFEEKVCLMTVLIDGIHDTDAFRKFLNDRVEEKSSFNKEKIEVYQAIRSLEQEQQELVKKHAESNFVNNEEAILKELEELRQKLRMASRTQAKEFRDRISELEAEKNHFTNENSRLEELIKKRQAHIAKLNEKLYKSSIKTTMLGQDAQRSEYWHFKDDCSRIYIRKEEVQAQPDVVIDDAEQIITDSQQKVTYQWYYYEREEQLDQLIERLNFKGIRERRLQDSLRRVKDILKLKKTRKSKVVEQQPADKTETSPEDGSKPEEAKPDGTKQDAVKPDELMNDEEKEPTAQEPSESVPDERHVMFETDDFIACLNTAVWFGQKVPAKRRVFGRGVYHKSAESEFGDNLVTIQECKNILVRIQNLYTETSKTHDREWTDKTERESWSKQVSAAQNCEALTSLMIKLDEGMCQPFYVAHRGGTNQRMKLQMFKFWPSSDLKHAWRQYVEDENTIAKENMNAFYIILRVLEQINEQFIIRQDEKMEKKNKAAINAAVSEKQSHLPSNQRGRVREVNYVKYFQSSDSEGENEDPKKDAKIKSSKRSEESEQSESESQPDQTAKSAISARQQRTMQRKEPAKKQPAEKSAKGRRGAAVSESESDSEQFSDDESSSSEEEVKRTTRGRGLAADRQTTSTRGRGKATRGRGGRSRRNRESDESSEQESQQEQSSEEDESSREWDEYCFICQDGGNVLCCEGCSQVAHVRCLKLKIEPTGDWNCPECLMKQTRTRLTRNHEAKTARMQNGKPTKAKRRY